MGSEVVWGKAAFPHSLVDCGTAALPQVGAGRVPLLEVIRLRNVVEFRFNV